VNGTESQKSSGTGMIVPILVGAVLALVGASVYGLVSISLLRDQLDQVRTGQSRIEDELTQTREQLKSDIANVQRDSSTALSEASKNTVEALKKELDSTRRQATVLAGQAKVEAAKRADELAAKLKDAQDEQARNVSEVKSAVSQVRSDADVTKNRVGEVSSEVGNVKTQLADTKSEMEKNVAQLRSRIGDLGYQSGLIATNVTELAALKAQGERIYTEFTLPKEKAARKIGDIQVRLKAADPKRNSYTVEVIADDKVVEKKDKQVNEPVQFLLSRAKLPYELVVNEIKKDWVSGYIAAPKPPLGRN